jgi:hypothetical protein
MKKSETYFGKGYIRQAEDGYLEFRLYVERTEHVKPYQSFNRRMQIEIGSLHPEEVFYDLIATAYDGTIWMTERLLPSFHWDMSQAVFANGKLISIKSQTKGLESFAPFLQLHFFDDFDVPLFKGSETERFGRKYMVTDKAEFEGANASWVVRKRDNRVVVEADSSLGVLPANFAQRVQEAIQFLVAQPVFYRARLAGQQPMVEFELTSPWRKPRKTQMNLPISRATDGYFQSSWGLFAKYLSFVCSRTAGTQWDPLAYHLYNAAEASGNSVDAWAVGYSVCLEALASFIVIEDDGKQKARITAFQARARAWLANEAEFTDLAGRLNSMTGNLSQERPHDKLYALARTGYVTEDYVKAWGKLRNKHVHPRPADLRRPDAGYMQEMLDLIHQVEVLIFQVVFYLIGYEGPHTDYGRKGFPRAVYPAAASTPQADQSPSSSLPSSSLPSS